MYRTEAIFCPSPSALVLPRWLTIGGLGVMPMFRQLTSDYCTKSLRIDLTQSRVSSSERPADCAIHTSSYKVPKLLI